MTAARKYFEDFEEGQTVVTGPYSLRQEEMLGFASRWDPQPVHLDSQAGLEAGFGGIATSGLQLLGIVGALRARQDPSPVVVANIGLDRVRFLAPVRAGDTLWLRATCRRTKATRGHAQAGAIETEAVLVNQHKEPVLTLVVSTVVAKRPLPAPAAEVAPPFDPAAVYRPRTRPGGPSPAAPRPGAPARGPGGPARAVPAVSVAGPRRGWYPDPGGRHQVRFWDGERWTRHVGDGGVHGFDPA